MKVTLKQELYSLIRSISAKARSAIWWWKIRLAVTFKILVIKVAVQLRHQSLWQSVNLKTAQITSLASRVLKISWLRYSMVETLQLRSTTRSTTTECTLKSSLATSATARITLMEILPLTRSLRATKTYSRTHSPRETKRMRLSSWSRLSAAQLVT